MWTHLCAPPALCGDADAQRDACFIICRAAVKRRPGRCGLCWRNLSVNSRPRAPPAAQSAAPGLSTARCTTRPHFPHRLWTRRAARPPRAAARCSSFDNLRPNRPLILPSGAPGPAPQLRARGPITKPRAQFSIIARDFMNYIWDLSGIRSVFGEHGPAAPGRRSGRRRPRRRAQRSGSQSSGGALWPSISTSKCRCGSMSDSLIALEPISPSASPASTSMPSRAMSSEARLA